MKKEEILIQVNEPTTKMSDLRKMAKIIKTNHSLALELWESNIFLARLLAILIMDKNNIDQNLIDKLDNDSQIHSVDERCQLFDWLMANQLVKSKKTVTLIDSWLKSSSALQRRIFWYYQARLRWTGKNFPTNTEELLALIETQIKTEVEEVQWAMNFTAAQIGIFQEKYRKRVINLGEEVGLYKEEKVSKNCTPNYLPLFIATQVEKLK